MAEQVQAEDTRKQDTSAQQGNENSNDNGHDSKPREDEKGDASDKDQKPPMDPKKKRRNILLGIAVATL